MIPEPYKEKPAGLSEVDNIGSLSTPSAFDQAIFDYLQKPIELNDKNSKPVFIYVDLIEPPAKGIEDFLRFNFRVRSNIDPNYLGPKKLGEKRRKAPHGKSFGYVFSASLTLEQNKANLNEFILNECLS